MAEIELNEDPRTSLINKVRTYDKDIRAFQSRIKDLNESVNALRENTTEFEELSEAQEKVKQARQNLKNRLQANQDFNNLQEMLADEKEALKAAKENMSDFLVAYVAETKERQIEIDPKDAREVIVKARLGKEQLYQPSIFGGNDEQ